MKRVLCVFGCHKYGFVQFTQFDVTIDGWDTTFEVQVFRCPVCGQLKFTNRVLFKWKWNKTEVSA